MADTYQDEASQRSLPNWEKIFGTAPVLSTEDADAYNALKSQVLACLAPEDVIVAILVKDYVNSEWEVNRLLRHKTLVPERKFRARLEYQATREKALSERIKPKDKPANAVERLEELEAKASDMADDVQSIFKRAANERDHAEGLESGIGYYEQLDKRLQVAISRRNSSLAQIMRYREDLGNKLQRLSNDGLVEMASSPQEVPLAPIQEPSQ